MMCLLSWLFNIDQANVSRGTRSRARRLLPLCLRFPLVLLTPTHKLLLSILKPLLVKKSLPGSQLEVHAFAFDAVTAAGCC